MSDWIDDLERKAKAATPGPWYAWDRGVGWLIALDPDGDVRLPEGMRTDLGRREDAEFIAAANPATILRLIEDNRRLGSVIKGHEAIAAALIAERDALAARTPCDGGCNYGDGPMEDCSRHGRPPAEVWQIVTEVQAQRDALAARLAAAEVRIANAHAFLDAEDAASEAKGRHVWTIETSLVRAALAAPTDTTKEN